MFEVITALYTVLFVFYLVTRAVIIHDNMDYDENFVDAARRWLKKRYRLLVKRLAILSLVWAPFIFGVNSDYGTGQVQGTVAWVEHTGAVFKSWEGMVIIGGKNDNGSSTGPLNVPFSVTDPVVVEHLKTAVLTGKRVKLDYTEWYAGPITVNTKIDVKQVTFTE